MRLKAVDRPYGLWLNRELPDDQGTVLLWGSQRYDVPRQIITVLEFFEVYDPANVMQERHMVELTFRLLSRTQFELMAGQTGLEVEALYGDYDRSAFDERSSPFMIWTLYKKP